MAYTTIDDPSAYFHTQLYTGTGSELSVTNGANAGDFKPDWIWIKQRNAATDHGMFDSSRGVTKNLKTNASDAESTEAQSVKTFNTDGFTLGTSGDYNGSSDTHVAWQWKANGGTATATASESGDNPAYSVQANTDAGFSIVTYTGTGADTSTVAHGLGATPKMIIFKRRDGTPNWMVHHANLASATKRVNLNTTNAEGDASNFLDDTAPTSSVFTLGFSAAVNADGGTFVAYCFAPIQGYSKFGSYTGNGNADGPFIYTGFKPSWVMIKVSSGSTGGWDMYDNKRGSYNGQIAMLQANSNGAEQTSDAVDFLSNGFKIRSTSGNQNGSGNTHIYMAFAESPFVSSEGVPTTAR